MKKGPIIRFIGVVVVLGLIGFAIAQVRILPPAKDDTVGVSDWLVVPVYYATNRTYSGDGKSVEYSEGKNGQKLLFGVKNVVVPFPGALGITEEKLKSMGWQRIHTTEAGKKPPVPSATCAVKDQLLTPVEITQSFRNYSDSTQAKQACLFVHGCCATFDSSMNRAGKIAAYMGIPVVLYDWESPVGFSKYLQNETRVHQTSDNFYKFLSRVEKDSDPDKIILLGHSMGAMFVDEAMVRRSSRNSESKPFNEIIMSNADVDGQSFINHAKEFGQNAEKCSVFVSKKDDRLDASAFAHGGFERLGAPGALLDSLKQIGQLDITDITAGDTGHELPFKLLSRMHNGTDSELGVGMSVERLDPHFSELRNTITAASNNQ